MKPYLSTIGRRLGSVAARYRHPLSAEAATFWGRDFVRKGRVAGAHHPDGGDRAVENALSRLEAVLFLSRQPQTSRKLAQLAGLADGTKARTLIRSINRRYDTEERAFRVEEVAGGFQLLTRPKFAPWLRRLHSMPVEIRLSASALETLAVVAYRQPVLRVEIEAIRGVQSGEVLRQLAERDFVRIVGRSNELGRPFLYGTTKHFLQIFGLRHLDELPRADILRNHGPAVTGALDSQTELNSSASNNLTQSPAAEEENVKTLIARKNRSVIAPEHNIYAMDPEENNRPDDQSIFAQAAVDDDDLDDDEDDDFEDEDLDEDEDEDEDLDDEPWEEVEDDEDEDWDDDDDEDEDWDDEDWDDDDWEDDDEDEEEEEAE